MRKRGASKEETLRSKDENPDERSGGLQEHTADPKNLNIETQAVGSADDDVEREAFKLINQGPIMGFWGRVSVAKLERMPKVDRRVWNREGDSVGR